MNDPITRRISWAWLASKEIIQSMEQLEALIRSDNVLQAIGEKGVKHMLEALKESVDGQPGASIEKSDGDVEGVLSELYADLRAQHSVTMLDVLKIRDGYRANKDKHQMLEALMQLAHKYELDSTINRTIRRAAAVLMDRKSYVESYRRTMY